VSTQPDKRLLAPYFQMWELTVTARPHLQDTPGPFEISNARILLNSCIVPLRTRVGVPFRVESFYRSLILNGAVGGISDSLHLRAAAIDFVPVGMHRRIVWEVFLGLASAGLAFTEALIYENSNHLHIGYAWWHPRPKRSISVQTDSGRVAWAEYDGPLRGGMQ
jgi:hypothetical protein